MFCRNCGSQMSDDAMFCPVCGTQTANAQQNDYQQDDTYYQQNDTYYQQNDTYYQEPVAQQDYYQQDNSFYQQPEEGGKKKGKKLGKKGSIIIAAVAVVLVAALVIGFTAPGITNLATMVGMSSEMNEVFEAAKKTVFDSKNLTIEYVQKYTNNDYYDYETGEYTEYSSERRMTGYIEFGDDVESTAALLEISGKSSTGYSEKAKAGMVDGEFYDDESGKTDFTVSDALKEAEDEISYYGRIDLEDTLNEILNGKIDEKAVEDIFDTVIRGIIEDMIDENLDADIEVPDYDECMKILKRFFVKGLSEDAVTFEKNGDNYEYTVDVGEVLDNFADFAEDDKVVSGYVEEIADAADEDADDFYDSIRDSARSAKSNDVEINGEVRVEGGRLTYLSVVEKGDRYSRSYEIIVSDINKTTVDKDEIKKLGR